MTFMDGYITFVAHFPLTSSFIKFAVLATAGEVTAFRLRTGSWPGRNFGVLPKAFAWGVLGIFILFAFKIFSTGVPAICGTLLPLTGRESTNMVLTAFYISLFMNVIFAPVMMLIHRIIDIKIEAGEGRIKSLLSINPSINELFKSVAWDSMWGFVFKKTIPLFWIPAHTITFLLPPEWRVLFAAVLSVALGLLLACADTGSRQQKKAIHC